MDHTLWDDMASDYDKSVEDNEDPVIVEYLDREINILSDICKTVCKLGKSYSIIDMGAGTGRVIFALDEKLQNDSIRFYGVEASDPMIKRANQKAQAHKGNSSVEFLKYDLRDSNLPEYFKSDTTNIVMCLYNTMGVVSDDKRQLFIDNMIKIAGKDGLAILTAFNGDNFGFVAPKLYAPMLPMIKQIDEDSFDEENRVFHNSLGFRSQWFTKNQLKSFLHTDVEPIPIKVEMDGDSHTLGNVYVNKDLSNFSN